MSDLKSVLRVVSLSLRRGDQRSRISPPRPAKVGMGSALFLEISSDTFQELLQYFSEPTLKVLSTDREICHLCKLH